MRAFLVFAAFFTLTACTTKSVYEPESDREGIRKVVGSHMPEMRDCYERAIEARPGAAGKLLMSWEIQRDGTVSSVVAKQTDESLKAIEPCAIERIRKWRFPPLGTEELATEVSYPFFFSENGQFKEKLGK